MNPEQLTKHLLHLYDSSPSLQERDILWTAINYIRNVERAKEVQQETFTKEFENRYIPDYNADQ